MRADAPAVAPTAPPAAHLAGAVALVAVVAVDPGGWYPFGPAKWWLVSSGVAAAVAATWWAGARPRLPRPVLILWVALLAWLSLAALAGRDPLYAWTGTPERHLGVLAFVLFAAACAVGSTFDLAAIRVWMRWLAAAAVVCGGYVLIEVVFGPPVQLAALTDRAGGPFGSAAYLGAALCLLVPVSLGVAADAAQPQVWRVAGAVGAVGGSGAMVASGTRGAWLGLAAAAVVGVVACRPSRRTVVALAVVGLAAIGATAPLLDEVVDRSTPADSRLDEWAMGARVLEDHPVVGVGPEGYRTALAGGVTAAYERTYGREVLPDRAHSGPLDVALAGGIPAATLYLALLVVVGSAVWRSLRGRDPALVAVALAVTAYGTQQLVLFPLAELDPTWWCAAGIVIAHTLSDRPPRSVEPVRARAAVAALVTVALFVTGLVGVAADRAAARAVDAVERADATVALAAAEHAVTLRPDVLRYRLLLAAVHADRGSLAGVDDAITVADRAFDLSPHDPIALRTAAALRTDRARITGRPDDQAEAVAAWTALVAADHACLPCRLGLGAAAALAGDPALAERSWTAARSLSRPGDTRAADALAALDDTAEQGGGG